ncbi:MAG: PAS domain-containing protein [Chitinophagaceae bacterium]|nr:MAG: PAS domain-containing protein [Chitinophagaceae bacterium]
MKNNNASFAAPGFAYALLDLCTLLIEGANEPLLAMGTDYRLQLVNPAAARWLGRPRKELLQESLLRYLPAGDSTALLAFLDRGLAGDTDGFSQAFELGGRSLLWTTQALRDPKGGIQGLLCRIEDRTEVDHIRRQVQDLQRSLQEKDFILGSRAQLAGTLLEATHGHTFVLDRALRFCAANRSYLEYTGRQIEDLMGRSLLECFPQAAATPLPEKIREAFGGRTLLLERVPCVLSDGNCNIQLTPLSYEGFVYGVLVVAEIVAD